MPEFGWDTTVFSLKYGAGSYPMHCYFGFLIHDAMNFSGATLKAVILFLENSSTLSHLVIYMVCYNHYVMSIEKLTCLILN